MFWNLLWLASFAFTVSYEILADVYLPSTDGLISIEAEHYATTSRTLTHKWKLQSSSMATGSWLLVAYPNSGVLLDTNYTQSSPRLDYAVQFDQKGVYYVWVRGRDPQGNGNNDSIHVGLDGAAVASGERVVRFSKSISWSSYNMNGYRVTLDIQTPGVHTINFWMREDGFQFDKFALTPSSSYAPSGSGPAVSQTSSTLMPLAPPSVPVTPSISPTPVAVATPTQTPAPTSPSPTVSLDFLPAFPGAMGFGAKSVGGRGGRVIFVTNLNPSGSGSLRAALTASGPRIVIFKVGGTITDTSDIDIRNPYLTVAGQTAPGDGILLRGFALNIITHDVVIRGLRIRVGDGPGVGKENRDGMAIYGPNSSGGSDTYNIVIDHCSIGWAIDENVSIWYDRVRDITFQWNIVSEGLRYAGHPDSPHSMGLLVGDHAKRVSVVHNLFAHNMDRNPLMKGDTSAEVLNNVIYNWEWFGSRLKDLVDSGGSTTESHSDFIGNYYKKGPNTGSNKGITVEGIAGSKVYAKDNIGPGRTDNSGDDWNVVNGSTAYRATARTLSDSNVIPQEVLANYTQVLQKAGAIAPHRDAVDIRIVQSVSQGTGKQIDSQSEVGGWPIMNGGASPLDTDGDGMPDGFESAFGLNSNDPSDANQDRNQDGFTNIEEYVNSLF